jgi:predicted HTH domain antitoxin
MFARGALSKLAAAALAGVDFFQFQAALADRHISSYTDEMLAQDMTNLASLKAA